MQLSKAAKVVLGFLSILSFLILPLIIIYVITVFVPEIIAIEATGEEASPEVVLGLVGSFIIGIIILATIGLGLTVFFIVHSILDKNSTSGDKVLWILLIIFLSNIVFPFYWYFRIWRSDSVGSLNGPDVLDGRSN